MYTNVMRMLEHRGAVITSKPMASEALVKELNQHEYVVITATRENDPVRASADITCVFVAPEGSLSARVQEYRVMFNAVKAAAAQSDRLHEYLIITDREPNSYISAFIATQNIGHTVRVYHYLHKLFKAELPKLAMIPKHELMTATEVDELCTGGYMTPAGFPKINHDEPMAVWMGLQPGMVVRIHRLSETAATAIAYRICD